MHTTVATALLISSVLLMDELYTTNMYIATVRDGDPSHLLAVGGSPWPVNNVSVHRVASININVLLS